MSINRNSPIGAATWAADTADLVPADGTILLVSLDTQRQAVTVINDAGSTGDLFVVPTAGQRRGGMRLAPGAGMVLATVAPIYGYVVTGRVTAYAVSESGVVC